MEDPIGCIEEIYRYFQMPLSEDTKWRMAAYLESKPKGKHGDHSYSTEKASGDRPLFRRYQELYDVPDEI